MVKGAAARSPAAGQIAAINPYRKALSVKGEEKIRFDTFSETTGTYLASLLCLCHIKANCGIASRERIQGEI